MEKSSRRKKRSATSIAMSASLKTKSNAKSVKLAFYDAEANYKQDRYANGYAIIGVKDTWQISTDHEQQFAVWLVDKPVRVADGGYLTVDLGNAALASVRVSVSPFAAEDPLKSGGNDALYAALMKSQENNVVERAYLMS